MSNNQNKITDPIEIYLKSFEGKKEYEHIIRAILHANRNLVDEAILEDFFNYFQSFLWMKHLARKDITDYDAFDELFSSFVEGDKNGKKYIKKSM